MAARYKYVGPPEAQGHVPGAGFSEGVLAPDHLARLLAAGYVVELSAVVEAKVGDVVEMTEDGGRLLFEAGTPEAEAFMDQEPHDLEPVRPKAAVKRAVKPAQRKAAPKR